MPRRKKQKLGGDALREKMQVVEMLPPGPLGPELRYTLKKMIREAIRYQNKQVLFTCRDCCFYQDADEKKGRVTKCTLDESNQLVTAKRMPTQLPECFLHDPLMTSFAGVLMLMYSLGIDTINAEHGWATICGRLAARQDRYGYISGITQKNLERYGTR